MQQIVKDQSSHLLYFNMHKITCENLSSIDCRRCEIIMKQKTPSSRKVVCFLILDFDTSKSNSQVLKSSRKLPLSRKLCFQREPFLIVFYTSNISQLFGFMLIVFRVITSSVLPSREVNIIRDMMFLEKMQIFVVEGILYEVG